jgi:UDP-3-O-[3-hydroxymyristoyl] N-acetylglucosamine deacetylase
VMAALYGLQVDNCVIEVNGEEMPGLDGSALAITQALRSAGLIVQAATKKRIVLDRTFRVGDETCWVEAGPVAGGHARYEYHLDYGDNSPIGPQSYRGTLSVQMFCHELAPARTFVTAQQVAQLQAQGVGKHVGPQDLLVFDHDGLIDNSFRFPNECARHKTLDLIGDLALAGVELIGRFVSHRGGHRLNAALARQLAAFAGTSEHSTSSGFPLNPLTTPRISAA